MHNDKVIEIFNMHHDDTLVEINLPEIADVLKNNFVEMTGDYFVHHSIVDLGEFDEMIAEKRGKPFYIPEKEELLKYKDEFYFEKTQEYNTLNDYVYTHFSENDRDMTEDLCSDILYHCKESSPMGTVLSVFSDWEINLDKELQLSEVIGMLVDMMNNTRIWINNGCTAKEVYEQGTATE